MANPHSVRISDKQMIVYAHEALYCLHESDWTVLGIYKTKTLAYKAMRRRLWQHYDRARGQLPGVKTPGMLVHALVD